MKQGVQQERERRTVAEGSGIISIAWASLTRSTDVVQHMGGLFLRSASIETCQECGADRKREARVLDGEQGCAQRPRDAGSERYAIQ